MIAIHPAEITTGDPDSPEFHGIGLYAQICLFEDLTGYDTDSYSGSRFPG
jgi:hypothetical protein